MNDDALEGIKQLGQISERLISAVSDMSKRLNATERLAEDLKRQQDELREQQDAMQRQGKINAWLALSLLLDIALSVLIGFGFVRIDSNSDHIGDVQERTSNEVLCPLYGLLLTAVETPRPDQVDTPEKRKRFKAAGETIRDGYASLDCKRRP